MSSSLERLVFHEFCVYVEKCPLFIVKSRKSSTLWRKRHPSPRMALFYGEDGWLTDGLAHKLKQSAIICAMKMIESASQARQMLIHQK